MFMYIYEYVYTFVLCWNVCMNFFRFRIFRNVLVLEETLSVSMKNLDLGLLGNENSLYAGHGLRRVMTKVILEPRFPCDSLSKCP